MEMYGPFGGVEISAEKRETKLDELHGASRGRVCRRNSHEFSGVIDRMKRVSSNGKVFSFS